MTTLEGILLGILIAFSIWTLGVGIGKAIEKMTKDDYEQFEFDKEVCCPVCGEATVIAMGGAARVCYRDLLAGWLHYSDGDLTIEWKGVPKLKSDFRGSGVIGDLTMN